MIQRIQFLATNENVVSTRRQIGGVGYVLAATGGRVGGWIVNRIVIVKIRVQHEA